MDPLHLKKQNSFENFNTPSKVLNKSKIFLFYDSIFELGSLSYLNLINKNEEKA